jgi:hypothetical protein
VEGGGCGWVGGWVGRTVRAGCGASSRDASWLKRYQAQAGPILPWCAVCHGDAARSPLALVC